MGLLAAALVAGLLAERGWDRRAGRTLLAMLLGNAAIYAFGLPWLSLFVGSERVLALGFLPFVPGDLVKLLVAAAMLPAGWRLLGRMGDEAN